MSMSAIASPRLGIGPLIRVNTSVSSVLFSSRKRSCWLAGWCGLQMALKPWPFHVPNRPARAPSGSGPPASALIASVASASGVASPANAKSESVCVPAVMRLPPGSVAAWPGPGHDALGPRQPGRGNPQRGEHIFRRGDSPVGRFSGLVEPWLVVIRVCIWLFVVHAGVVVQVRLLGPVDVAVDGGSRPVNGLRRKAVLAALALHDGQVVSTDRLVDVVWGETVPPTVVNSLQTHISYLRGVLGSRDAILARSPGYLLNLGGDSTDAQAAERLLRQGKQAADPAQGARDLTEALALWRGRPLADVAGSAWLEEQAQRLDLLADEVRRALFEARLAAGEHAELVSGLERMAAEDPLDEQAHGQLMLALYRCGRQADALAVFHRLRAVLAEQLGIDPSPMLRDLETAILRQDEALAAPARMPASLAARPVPVPAQLPLAVPGFAGRAAELASLDAALARAERE